MYSFHNSFLLSLRKAALCAFLVLQPWIAMKISDVIFLNWGWDNYTNSTTGLLECIQHHFERVTISRKEMKGKMHLSRKKYMLSKCCMVWQVHHTCTPQLWEGEDEPKLSLEEVTERPTTPWASCLMHHLASPVYSKNDRVKLTRILWNSRILVLVKTSIGLHQPTS